MEEYSMINIQSSMFKLLGGGGGITPGGRRRAKGRERRRGTKKAGRRPSRPCAVVAAYFLWVWM